MPNRHAALKSVLASIILTLCLALPALANGGISFTYFDFGGLSGMTCAWTGIALTLCVYIEGAFYRWVRWFRHPFQISLAANLASMILGFPLFILVDQGYEGWYGVAYFFAFYVVPASFSIVVEGAIVYLYALRELHPTAVGKNRAETEGASIEATAPTISRVLPKRHLIVAILAGNVISNIVIFALAYLVLILLKHYSFYWTPL
jgi:hypothetical protein